MPSKKTKVIVQKTGSTSIGFGSALTLILITLKLTGHIDWSWIWVLFPFWLPVAAMIGLALGAILMVALFGTGFMVVEFFTERHAKKKQDSHERLHRQLHEQRLETERTARQRHQRSHERRLEYPLLRERVRGLRAAHDLALSFSGVEADLEAEEQRLEAEIQELESRLQEKSDPPEDKPTEPEQTLWDHLKD